MKVVITDAAKTDLVAIRSYLRERNPAAARAVGGELRKACLSLDALAERGRPGLVSGTRDLIISSYVIVYRVARTGVEILRVWHRAQDRLSG